MQMPHYLSATYVKLLIQANQHLAPSIEHALKIPLVTLLKNPFIDGRHIEQLITLFHQHGLDSWVLRHGTQLGVTSHGPLGFAVLSAPDLKSAITVAADYSIIRLSFYACSLNKSQKRIGVIFQPQTDQPLISRWMIESGIHVVKQLVETIVAHPLGDNASIQFSFSKPAYKNELERFYGIKCSFDQTENSISIPASWGEISSPLSDPATYRSNLRKCQELKQSLIGESEIIESTRLVLRNYFEQQRQNYSEANHLPSLTSLAQDKNMTPRTFSRRLDQQNYSYRTIMEEVRKEQACLLLKSAHLSIADISCLLAYGEPANFIRAFKSWFSCTPTQWRRQNH